MDLSSLWDDTQTELGDTYRELIGFLIGAVQALVVLIVATVVARWLRRRTVRVLAKGSVERNVAALIANGVSIAVYVLAAGFVLGVLGAEWTAVLAFLSVGTLAISLAIQDVLKNFVSGVYILLERPFTIGDRVKVRDVEGEIEGIDIRTTVIRNRQEERVIVPNATMFAEILTNRSAHRSGRTTLTLEGVQSPPAEIEAAVHAALDGLPGLHNPPPEVRVRKLGADGATVAVFLWHAAAEETGVTGAAMTRLRDAFPDATIATDGD
ncbi:MAG: hypothetical protein AVDCRST_MAG73-3584 [uncultured Thermomicrobiales bacterium]|uniref:Mechanosensitive ion channel MscS domain-containing protein n=1 Tax=uncultured Thermomicrobiales bacterium TaxID=1645740 RepID=A0A6J4UX83_9BACT|nr:MAG: hypothetical protein AVDCRST_MAG73-3584 [uncultured Thermomicrobiales bacterium]